MYIWLIKCWRNLIYIVFFFWRSWDLLLLTWYFIYIHIGTELIWIPLWALNGLMQLVIRDLGGSLLICNVNLASNYFTILLHVFFVLYNVLWEPLHGGIGLLRRAIEENLCLFLANRLLLDAAFGVEGLFWIWIVGLCLWKWLFSLRCYLEAGLLRLEFVNGDVCVLSLYVISLVILGLRAF